MGIRLPIRIGACRALVRSRALVGLVPPDDATSGGSQHPMVPRIVTGRTAYEGAFDAAFGRCWSGHTREREGESSKIETCSHVSRTFCSV
jgi:hypothetical protein